MIAHLRGLVLLKSPAQVVLECAGVGYDVAISVPTFSLLPGEGKEAALHVYTAVREDAIALYGFVELEEKRLFEKLISVSGIGPSLGIKVLSGMAAPMLVAAIKGNDVTQLTKVPGIGKKTAERLVLELKDKLDEMTTASVPAAEGGFHAGPAGDDVLSAMVNLGYQRAAAQKAIEAAVKQQPELAANFEGLFRASMGAVR